MTIFFLAKRFIWVFLMRLRQNVEKNFKKMKIFTFVLILIRKPGNFAYFSTRTTIFNRLVLRRGGVSTSIVVNLRQLTSIVVNYILTVSLK
jgi:hypothetical protein